MRGAQPALRDRRMRIDRALEGDLPQVGREHAEDEKQIGVGGRGGNSSFAASGPVISVSFVTASEMNVTPSPMASKLTWPRIGA